MIEQVDGIVVVGAGAAGLWAAQACALRGAPVLLLEKTPRTGTKILASGGTRCNLTTTLEAEQAGRLFGKQGERFLQPALRNLPPQAVVDAFESWGVPCVRADLEKIFPESQKAKDVRDAMERVVREAGVEIRENSGVLNVTAIEGGGFQLSLAGGEELRCNTLMLCTGGQSYAGSGTTGDGYAWLKSLGLQMVGPVPALAPLRSSETWVHELSGIAIQDAEVRLMTIQGKELMRRRRPLMFTHKGLSGPAAMDVSGLVARAQEQAQFKDRIPNFSLLIDVCASTSREALRDELVEASRASGSPRLARALGARFPRRLVEAVCDQAGVPSNPPIAQITKAMRHQLVEAFKGLCVQIEGTLGFDAAEVTGGGLKLKEVNPRTMQVNRVPGLYVFGELLDVDGPIGGFNFQAAFATAQLASEAACPAEASL
jgi:predicted Rossmann fold flavoprotein